MSSSAFTATSDQVAIPRPLDPMPAYQPASPSPSSPTPSSASSSTSSPAIKSKPVKKRQKKVSVSGPGGTGKGEGEGLHVCVTCGRTDSPEWRKGPLGPKTLCNVSQPYILVKTPLTSRRVVCDGQRGTVRLQAEKRKSYWQKRKRALRPQSLCHSPRQFCILYNILHVNHKGRSYS